MGLRLLFMEGPAPPGDSHGLNVAVLTRRVPPQDKSRRVAIALLRRVGRRLPQFPADFEPLLLGLVDQQVEREDAGQVSVRNSVSEQILRLFQLVA